MGHEHIRPTRMGAWCITVPTGTAKMEIPVKERPVTMFRMNSGAISLKVWTVAALGLIVICEYAALAMPTIISTELPAAQARSGMTGCAGKPVITAPGKDASVAYTEIVKGTTTCNGWRHYVIVTPSNGVDYVQNKECTFPSRNAFTCSSVQFGEGKIGIGQQFNVRIAVVKDTLVPGPLQEIPADAMLSLPISVTRVQ